LSSPNSFYDPIIRLNNKILNNFIDKSPHKTFSDSPIQMIKPIIPKSRKRVYPRNSDQENKPPIFNGVFESGNIDIVYERSKYIYEITVKHDPGKKQNSQWFFFAVNRIPPGNYLFIISGLRKKSSLMRYGVCPVAFSRNDSLQGIGWQRFGNNVNMWLSSSRPPKSYSISFEFSVKSTDEISFANQFPYTYSDMIRQLHSFSPLFFFNIIGKSHSGVEIPAIFWDCDMMCFRSPINSQSTKNYQNGKPLIILASRIHPGETVSSYAMHGFINTLFNESSESKNLLSSFSFFIVPMMNPDGVICGWQRPAKLGYDMNRVWKTPSRKKHTEAMIILDILDSLCTQRKPLFFLDFHGHAGQWNAFTYGVSNPNVPLNEFESLFPKLMAENCPFFDIEGGCSLSPEGYDTTMRVALHHRYAIPFSYTLEMSYGGCDLLSENHQMVPTDYMNVGECVAYTLSEMFNKWLPPFL